jgi:stage II sporulation protein D
LASISKTVDLNGWDFRIVTESGASTWLSPERTLQHLRVKLNSEGEFLFKASGHHWENIHVDELQVQGVGMRLGLKPVPDHLTLVPTEKGTIDVVGELTLDAYLNGVISAEMPASWPMEALKAQAVAARSFALFMVHHHSGRDYDLEASVFDQAFNYEPIPAQTESAQRVRRALDETRGDVLVDGARHVLKAYYSADCGCQSEDPKYVWGGRSDFMESVKDPTCRLRQPVEWNFTVGRSEIRQKLIAALGISKNSDLRALHVANRTPSGRVNAVVMSWGASGDTQSTELTAQEFRRILGFHRVRSADFNISWMGDELQISGQGMGHGVGLCQRGARTLSEQGLNYKEILKFYYPRAVLATGF